MFETGSFTDLELTALASLASQQAPGISCLCLHSSGITDKHDCVQPLHSCWGSELRSSSLFNENSEYWAISPTSLSSFKKHTQILYSTFNTFNRCVNIKSIFLQFFKIDWPYSDNMPVFTLGLHIPQHRRWHVCHSLQIYFVSYDVNLTPNPEVVPPVTCTTYSAHLSVRWQRKQEFPSSNSKNQDSV